ncbi:N-acetyltransferase family protein [Nocardia sp. CA-135398]|uniref:GNAT family N-acetyltransferase n=1 Tax=Nocardia sp. CA-135398 TaxID=3239977 RepID=UPI003D99314C
MNTTPDLRIEPMRPEQADQALAIYQLGIDDGDATFETTAPTWAKFDNSKLPDHRFVALDPDDRVLGWIAVVPVSDRCAYAGVVEHSVYVHPTARSRGVGLTLLNALLESTTTAGIWTVQSGIFPENTASIALHTKAGFRTIGTRERIGRHHDRWSDVLLIEHRSPTIG